MAPGVNLSLAAKPDLPEAAARHFALPAKAQKISSNVYYLGQALDKEGVVEGYAILKYKDESAKVNPAKQPAVTCYGFLGKGAKWKAVEPYLFNAIGSNASSTGSLDPAVLKGIMASSIGKWEAAAGKDILGNETTGVIDGADSVAPDNKNEVYFGSIDEPGVIAVTIVWGIFSGPTFQQKIVEWDMVFDEVDFNWSASGEAYKMDFENIATHELGHSVGMKDTYNAACSLVTMYGYASEGEIIKRTLESADITGVKTLYR